MTNCRVLATHDGEAQPPAALPLVDHNGGGRPLTWGGAATWPLAVLAGAGVPIADPGWHPLSCIILALELLQTGKSVPYSLHYYELQNAYLIVRMLTKSCC